jgi:hypothetical protein
MTTRQAEQTVAANKSKSRRITHGGPDDIHRKQQVDEHAVLLVVLFSHDDDDDDDKSSRGFGNGLFKYSCNEKRNNRHAAPQDNGLDDVTSMFVALDELNSPDRVPVLCLWV